MALVPDEFYGAKNTVAPLLRFYNDDDGIRPGKFANIAGAPTLANGTPLAYDETNSEWNVWNPAIPALNNIKGFLWLPGGETFTADATNEKLVQIFRHGLVDARDVPLPTTAAQTQAQLDTALSGTSALRQLLLRIVGIAGVH